MIKEIKLGDKLFCLNCRKKFELKKIVATADAELIVCPHCKAGIDIQNYHLYGGKVETNKNGKSKTDN